MQIAPALRYAFRFVSLSAVVFTIVFAVHPLFGEEIDPRDYIGEDISKYPAHLRQQIERAFLRETGERFTGSQYDPRSPNYKFKRKSNRNYDIINNPYYLPNDEKTIDERLSSKSFLEAQFRSRPELSRGYDFEELEDRYPMVPAQVKRQRMADVELRQEDLKYKEKILEEKTLELELKKVERELEKIESNSNTVSEIQDEVYDAKIALESLNPSDFDFIIKVTEIQKKYPLAFKHEPFIKNVLNPMLLKKASSQ